MSLDRILDVGNDIAGNQDIDRCPDLVQTAKDVQRVMLETGKWPSCEQQIDGDALRHRVLSRHCRDASGFRHQ